MFFLVTIHNYESLNEENNLIILASYFLLPLHYYCCSDFFFSFFHTNCSGYEWWRCCWCSSIQYTFTSSLILLRRNYNSRALLTNQGPTTACLPAFPSTCLNPHSPYRPPSLSLSPFSVHSLQLLSSPWGRCRARVRMKKKNVSWKREWKEEKLW